MGICEGGLERTNETLARLGLNMDSLVSMQTIMRELGLTDTLYSFCKVTLESRAEAQKVLGEFIKYETELAYWLINFTRSDLSTAIKQAARPIKKRAEGTPREALQQQEYESLSRLYYNEPEAHIKHWINAFRCLLSNEKSDSLAATHAAMALMDGADIIGIREEIHKRLCDKLNELLGPEPSSQNKPSTD